MLEGSAAARRIFVAAALEVGGCSGSDPGETEGASTGATTTATTDEDATAGPSTTTGASTSSATTVTTVTSDTSSASDPGTGEPSTSGPATTEAGTTGGVDVARECDAWPEHPEWIFCDDFESDAPLVGPGRYFEGDMPRIEGAGLAGSAALEAAWSQGQVGAGGVKLAFGEVPDSYFDNGVRPGEHFDELYYRMLVKHEAGWEGAPAKLSRATVFVDGAWSQAMIAHVWSHNTEPYLGMDPVRCVESGAVVCSGYNDFNNMSWLGFQLGDTPIFTPALSDQWVCVEVRVRLNDPGVANGVQTVWIDGALEVSSESLDFMGTYEGFGLNAVFFENYWNDGALKDQRRWFDNIIVSEAPIGCPG